LDLLSKLKELEAMKGVGPTAETLQRDINSVLAKYPIRYAVSPSMSTAISVSVQFVGQRTDGLRMNEHHAVAMLIDLTARGLLSDLKQCAWGDCGRWFLAKRKDQKFHDNQCKRKHVESSPEFKAHRAEYMRGRYWGEKEQGAEGVKIVLEEVKHQPHASAKQESTKRRSTVNA
jgi:hypothetical protein